MAAEERLYELIPSTFGELALVWTDAPFSPKVVEILLPLKASTVEPGMRAVRTHPGLVPLVESISRYLAGEDVDLPTDLLDRSCCSPFQWTVLMAERSIPRGFVTSYSNLAAQAGRPRAQRAVGSALASNPFPLVIPCHRTVRRDGSLGGYGGGLPMKRALLHLEGVGFDPLGRVRPQFFWHWETCR
jgi:methylated-DNA-[protein]-cysteine S-methyltransferase